MSKIEISCLYCSHRSKGFVEGRGPCTNKKAIKLRGTSFPYAEMDKTPCPYFDKETEAEPLCAKA